MAIPLRFFRSFFSFLCAEKRNHSKFTSIILKIFLIIGFFGSILGLAARVSNDVFTFEVSTNHESQIGAIDEVTSRICKFCEVFPKKKVQLQYNITTSQNSRAIEIFAATFCPQEIEVSTNGKTKLTQLTQPGKCDDVLISVQLRNVLSKKEETGCKIKVLLKCYSRSKEGNQIITIVQNSLRGEVTRTNRKWNRSKRRESNAKTES